MRFSAGSLWQDRNWVLPSSTGAPQDSRNVREALAYLKRACGYRHSCHGLRHFSGLRNEDRAFALNGLEVPVGAAAKSTCTRASRDGWQECTRSSTLRGAAWRGSTPRSAPTCTKRIAPGMNPLPTDL